MFSSSIALLYILSKLQPLEKAVINCVVFGVVKYAHYEGA